MGAKVSSGSSGGRRDTTPVVDPNVIPFIDIMLVLLIIFMVTAPTPTVDVRVDLPPPNPRPTPPQEGIRPTFVHLIDVNGVLSLTVDGEPTTIDQLGNKVLERAILNNWALPPTEMYAQARVFIRADQNTAYGNVINVMSRLQEEGYARVGIFAERAEL
ncbi:MAG: biopolymer transporter ExbD [Hyphomonadaceae bacterium]